MHHIYNLGRVYVADDYHSMVHGQGVSMGKKGNQSSIQDSFNTSDVSYEALLIKHVSDAIISTDNEFIIKSWNRGAERIYGFTAEEVLEKPIAVLTKRVYLECSREDAIRIFRKNGYWEGEVLETRKDGKVIRVLTSVSNFKDEHRGVSGIVAVNRDITEFKQEETRRNRERKAFRIIAEAAIHGGSLKDVCWHVLNGLVQILNYEIGSVRLYNASNKILEPTCIIGVPEENIPIIAPDQPIDHPYFLAALVARTKTAIFAPDVFLNEISQTHEERLNEVGIRSLISWPILGSEKSLLGVLHLVSHSPKQIPPEDRYFFQTVAEMFAIVLERKKTDLAFKKSEENYRRIFNSITDTYYQADINGNLILLSPSGVKGLGYRTAEELLGKNIANDFYEKPKERQTFLKLLRQNGEVKNYEINLRRKDGSTLTVEVNAKQILDNQGNMIGVEGIYRDVTDRKRMENELLKNQKLESIGILAGGIAHDFNNLLTAIMGNISLVKTILGKQHTQYSRLGLAEQAALRARDLTHQLLTFSKGGEPVKQIVVIPQIVKDSVSFALQGSSVYVRFDLPPYLWPVEIDVGQITQVINNLTINAVQAMKDGGEYSVSAENVIIDNINTQGLNCGKYLKISFSDNGCGITSDILSRIFDPYFTTKEHGSGLGLATSYSIMKKHQGHISVTSEPKIGSTFSLFLKAADESNAGESTDPEFTRLEFGKILVLEDELIVQETVSMMIEELGYSVDCASCGKIAIEMYKEAMNSDRPYDAILMDVTIRGGMGGAETIQNLLKLDPEARAAVYSGYSNDPILAQFKSYGFIDCMTKPFKMNDLAGVLSRLIHR